MSSPHPPIPSNQEQNNQPSGSRTRVAPLSPSFFNSHYNQQNFSNRHSDASNHPSGLSRFLSTSFVNPIYRSKVFPSTAAASENPLFYSTREGYEIGLHSDEDILPLEDDHRLSSGNLISENSRGIDDAFEDPQSAPSSPLPPTSLSKMANLQPLAPSYLKANQDSFHSDQSHATADEDPFYNHPHPATTRKPIQNRGQTSTHPALPRHLMASQALSNMMTSEISYGNRHHHHHAQSNHPSSSSTQSHEPVAPALHPHTRQTTHTNPQRHSGGWRIYQSIGPGSVAFEPQTNLTSTNYASSSEPPGQPFSHPTYSSESNPPMAPELRHDPYLQSELTERPPTDHRRLLLQVQTNSEAYPDNQTQFNSNLSAPTVFIYPTEARDIGSEVPGQNLLGPQNYRDSFWILAWLASLLYAFIETVWVLFFSTPTSTGDQQNDDERHGSIGNRSNNLMKTLPILALLITITFGICLCSLSLLLLVKRSIKYLVYGTILAIPSILGMVGLWTWSEAISDQSQRGMGYLSFLTILISGVFLKFMWSERGRIDRTIQVLNLSISVVVEHPSLVVVSLTMSMACIILSIPFITLIFQLIINGNQPQLHEQLESILNSGTLTQVLVTGFIWSWSLNVIRNLQRIIIAGVVSHWYFNRHSPPPLTNDATEHQKMYSSIDSTYQSISRAVGPSFGTVCLSGFLLTIFDSLSKTFKIVKNITPLGSRSESSGTGSQGGTVIFKKLISNVLFLNSNNNFIVTRVVKNLVEFLNELFDFLNSFTIVYSDSLAKSILNIISLTMSLTISLIGYHIYQVTTSLPSKPGSDPQETRKGLIVINDHLLPLVFVLFGLLPFWIFRFLTDLILNSIDTLLSFPLLIYMY